MDANQKNESKIGIETSRILYEDNHLLVVNKLPGEIVQGDKTGDKPLLETLKEYIKLKYNKAGEVFLGLVHRVDRPVSGAVIFARTSKSLSRMTTMVKDRQFAKTYLAITDNAPDFKEKELTGWLKKNEQQNKSYLVPEGTPGSKWASLTCRHIASGKTVHLLEIDLHTGRHHQIRTQLAAAGLVIRGDVKYGARRANTDGSICLHAYRLRFNHPVGGKPLDITAPLPKDPAWHAFNNLKGRIVQVLLFLFCFAMLSAKAQYFDIGQERSSLKWNQIKTQDFKIIYPDYYGGNALTIAHMLQSWRPAITASLQTNAPHTPLVLHTRSMTSNAYTVWAPRRLEFLMIPPQDTYPQLWMEQLVLHEYRHIAQISKLNSGFTKTLGILLGQQAIPAMIGIFVPPWFLEGDAVAAETGLTSTGRGRVAGFHNPFKAILFDKGVYSYPKAVLGSYKDFVPNHYIIGYHIVASGRMLYGADIWSNALERTARRPYTLNPFSSGIKRSGGGGKHRLYKQSMQLLDSLWRQPHYNTNISQIPTSSPKVYTSYRFPFAVDSAIVALKTSLNKIPAFVSIDPVHKEKIIHVPGYYLDNDISFNGTYICWMEQKPHIRWETEGTSTIVLLNPRTGKALRNNTGLRVFAPAVNPTNTLVVTSEVSVTGNNTLTFFPFGEGIYGSPEILSNNVKTRVSSPGNAFIASPCWSPDGKEVAFIATTEKGKSIMRFVISDSAFLQATPWSFDEINRPQHLGDRIVFNMDVDERSEVCSFELSTGIITRLTHSAYGTDAVSYHPSGNRILFGYYTAEGNRLGTMLLISTDEIIKPGNANTWPLAQVLSAQEKSYNKIPDQALNNLSQQVMNNDTGSFTVSPYKKAKNLFYFHSWAPVYVDVNDQNLRLGFSIMSQNLLSTLFFNTGYDYNLDEETGTWRTSLTYKGWFPEISVLYEYGSRQMIQGRGDTARRFRWNESSVSLRIAQRLSWLQGPYSVGLYFAIEPQATTFLHTPSTPASFLNGTAGSFNYWFSGYMLRKTALRDLASRLGITLNLHYRHAPFGDFIPNPLYSAQSRIYLPGILPNHSLQLYGAWQHVTTSADGYRFSADIGTPEGFIFYSPDNLIRIRPSYALPLFYPDWNAGTFLYVKRIRTSIFHDYTWSSGYHQSETDFHISGIDLTADFHLFSLPAPVSLGLRTNYRHQYQDVKFSLIFNFDLSQY